MYSSSLKILWHLDDLSCQTVTIDLEIAVNINTLFTVQTLNSINSNLCQVRNFGVWLSTCKSWCTSKGCQLHYYPSPPRSINIYARIFYLTESSTNIRTIALTLVLIVLSRFPTLKSILYDSKKSCSLSSKTDEKFRDLVKT